MHSIYRSFLVAVAAMFLSLLPMVANSAPERSASQIVIENQILAFRHGAHEKAFKLATPSLQIVFRDVENFIRMVKRGYGPIYAARSWTFGRTKAEGGKIYHEVLISGPDGREWVALYTMQKLSDGSWRIAGVRLLRGNASST